MKLSANPKLLLSALLLLLSACSKKIDDVKPKPTNQGSYTLSYLGKTFSDTIAIDAEKTFKTFVDNVYVNGSITRARRIIINLSRDNMYGLGIVGTSLDTLSETGYFKSGNANIDNIPTMVGVH